MAGAIAVALLISGRLPSDTRTASLTLRAAVGLAIGLALVMFVRRMLRSLTDPPPPLPDAIDASTTDVVYVCPVCGTRLRLELAATGKPPKHCGEEMEPSIAG